MTRPLWVDLGPDQAHPIDLRWVDEMMVSARPHLMVRPADELLILVPNTPLKVNGTALRLLGAMLDEGLGIAEVLNREGDRPARRREIHSFFTDLAAWLNGTLGEGVGRRAVVHEPFTAEFCTYPVLAEVALTYRCNLSCGFCYAGCGVGALPEGWSEGRVMGGVAVINAILDGPGKIKQMGGFQHFTFGELDGTISPRAQRLKDLCDAAGLEATLSPDITKALWEKFVFLVGVSSMTALTRQWSGVVRDDPELRPILLDVMHEVTAVGQACGIGLADDTGEQRLAVIDGQDGRSIASMTIDLLRGNKLELPWLAGKVVALGLEKGVPTPVLRVIYAGLRPYINGRPEDSPTG